MSQLIRTPDCKEIHSKATNIQMVSKYLSVEFEGRLTTSGVLPALLSLLPLPRLDPCSPLPLSHLRFALTRTVSSIPIAGRCASLQVGEQRKHLHLYLAGTERRLYASARSTLRPRRGARGVQDRSVKVRRRREEQRRTHRASCVDSLLEHRHLGERKARRYEKGVCGWERKVGQRAKMAIRMHTRTSLSSASVLTSI
jgi:hypothetical protein